MNAAQAATAQIALTKALRLMQIASGFVTVDNPDGSQSIHKFDSVPKESVLFEELEALTSNHKVIVWSIFTENLDRIFDRASSLNMNPARMYGSHSSQEQIDKFQSDPSCRVMVANPASGGTGITLTASSVSIYYANGFNFAHREQSEGRNHRIGSEIHESITYIDLMCTDTIEEDVLSCPKERKDFADIVLNLGRKK